MKTQLMYQQIIPITEARSRLSRLAEETEKDKWFFLTKGGRPKVVLVGVDLWLKINKEIQKFTQKTFINTAVLPFIRSFTDKEVNQWLKEDKLTSKQKKMIAQSGKV